MCNPVTTKRPENLLSKGTHLGFEWEVTNNGIGYRCGYIKLPPGHPWYGKGYDDDLDPYPDVHGGLTFAEPDTECGKGGADDGWWLGFDCAHAGDAKDYTLRWDAEDYKPRSREIEAEFPQREDVVRTTEYVEAECRRLCEQAEEASRADSGGVGT